MLVYVAPPFHETAALTWHDNPALTLALNVTTNPSSVAPDMDGMWSACHCCA